MVAEVGVGEVEGASSIGTRLVTHADYGKLLIPKPRARIAMAFPAVMDRRAIGWLLWVDKDKLMRPPKALEPT